MSNNYEQAIASTHDYSHNLFGLSVETQLRVLYVTESYFKIVKIKSWNLDDTITGYSRLMLRNIIVLYFL